VAEGSLLQQLDGVAQPSVNQVATPLFSPLFKLQSKLQGVLIHSETWAWIVASSPINMNIRH